MSKIVELNAQEIAEVAGGKGLIAWLESVFGEDPVDTGDHHFVGIKG
jgi:hypothetical protein